MRITALAILGFTIGCAEWPRVANVEDPPKVEDASVDLGDLVQIDWIHATEAEGTNDQPTDVGADADVAHGNGVRVVGTVNGSGFGGTVQELMGCTATGHRSPLPPADYLGDVDFIVLEIQDSGTLCGSFEIDKSSGWDLVPHHVNDCNIPTGIVTDSNGDQVGTDFGGTFGAWAANVVDGDRIAVGFAGFGDDPGLVGEYSVALSLVKSKKDGTEGVCPTHPSEDQ